MEATTTNTPLLHQQSRNSFRGEYILLRQPGISQESLQKDKPRSAKGGLSRRFLLSPERQIVLFSVWDGATACTP